MEVYCTNPECWHLQTESDENLFNKNNLEQRYCSRCSMPLILNKRYLPLEEIGRGGFGRTFRATDLNLNDDCAVKILHPHQRLNPSQLQHAKNGFERGARI